MDPGLYCLLDAVGTVAFAMSGAFKAVRHRLDLLGVLVFGFATAVGGGMIRDVLVREVPMVLSADFYATAALIGGLAFVVCSRWGVPPSLTSVATFAVTFLLRVMAIWRGWHLPRLEGSCPPSSPHTVSLFFSRRKVSPRSSDHQPVPLASGERGGVYGRYFDYGMDRRAVSRRRELLEKI